MKLWPIMLVGLFGGFVACCEADRFITGSGICRSEGRNVIMLRIVVQSA